MTDFVEHSRQIIDEAMDKDGPHIVTSSFGIQSAVMLDLLQDRILDRTIQLVFVDSGTLHEKTYEYRDTLSDRFGIQPTVYEPLHPSSDPERLFRESEATFLHVHKKEPTARMLEEIKPKVWFSGRRALQTDDRTEIGYFEEMDGLTRVHPILHWTDLQVIEYLVQKQLPFHPLAYEGATRIGQRFETVHRKTECGMHDYQI